MSVLWHIMFWVLLPVSIYASIWVYADYKEGQR